MCGSEPCHRCQILVAERADWSKSLLNAVDLSVKYQHEVERLKADLLAQDAERLRLGTTLAKIAAIVADTDAALVVDRIREVLEPTPKGKP
jgi:hypothetical protein